MMKALSLILTVALALSFSSCADPVKKNKVIVSAISENVSKGVYATNDSIHSGRFDLAQKYSDETVRLVPPPKKRVLIQPITQ